MTSPWDQARQRVGARVHSLGRTLEQPGHLRRKLTGVHIDEDVMAFSARPYVRASAFRSVLDIGANKGQFARAALQAFPSAKVFSFEPQPSAHEDLGKLAAASDGRLKIEPFALGEHDGSVSFNVTTFSPSSSVLALEPSHASLGDQITLEKTVEVPMKRLADWAASTTLAADVLVKLDVQGYEASVLRGAGPFLRDVRIIIAETIFAPLYKGQASLGELCALLEPFGFQYREAFGIIREPRSGEPMWQDSVFCKAESPTPSPAR